ncbi:MAG: hypothetical protein K2X66_18465 [Cyanobacteria bacterium]|nr:hypothetical protein [Cyanobacteriota bacterium]
MGFLKKFISSPLPEKTLSVAPNPVPETIKISPPIIEDPLIEAHLVSTESPKARDGRIEAIEEEALKLGWKQDQLWRKSIRTDERGLVSYLQPNQSITEVTCQFIRLQMTSKTGKIEVQRFYNMDIVQPWMKRISKGPTP